MRESKEPDKLKASKGGARRGFKFKKKIISQN